MGNHDGRPIKMDVEFSLKPCLATLMQLNRLFRKLASRPFDAAQTHADVTGKNDDISASIRRREFGEFRVNITEYVKLHCDRYLENALDLSTLKVKICLEAANEEVIWIIVAHAIADWLTSERPGI